MLHCNRTPGGGNVSGDPQKDRSMSPQLTLSSLFSVLALAGLCIVTSAQDLAGAEAPVMAELSASTLEG
jgi:hypothetical protein